MTETTERRRKRGDGLRNTSGRSESDFKSAVESCGLKRKLVCAVLFGLALGGVDKRKGWKGLFGKHRR